jgi:3-oxoadipate enol-lactonase
VTTREGRCQVGDGNEIAYRFDGPDDGAAPVLVMAHSIGTSRALFDPVVAALAATVRVLRYDGRGHGASSVPTGDYGLDRLALDALDLLDGLALERVHFLGLSLGGAVGQAVASRAPTRIDRLILANTSAYFGPPSNWEQRRTTVRAQGMAGMVGGTLERGLTPGFVARSPETVAVLRRLIEACPPDGYAGSSAALRDSDQRRSIEVITAATLVIGGAHDPSTPPAAAHFLRDHIPGARYVELDAAHLSCLEVPDAFAAAVLDFLG